MRKLVIVLVLTLAYLGAIGQTMERRHHPYKGKHPHRIKIFTEYLTQELELTQDQQEKVRKIFTEERDKIKELRSKYKEPRKNEEFRKQRRAIIKETNKAIMETLTEEQAAKFKEMIPGWRKKAREWYKANHPKEDIGKSEDVEEAEE